MYFGLWMSKYIFQIVQLKIEVENLDFSNPALTKGME